MTGALDIVARAAVALGLASAVAVAVDLVRRGGHRSAIMNLVWPVTALYAGPLAIWAYWKESALPHGEQRPLWRAAAVGATHCGAGCTIGDLLVEASVPLVPFTLFGRALYASWALDFLAAFALGIAFQYFTLSPRKHRSVGNRLRRALKADAASLTAWQFGMYGWMAVAIFGIFGGELAKDGPLFWFMMQVAMLAGFAVAWPVNVWLIQRGIKQRM